MVRPRSPKPKARGRRRFRRVAVLAKPGTPEGQRIASELGSWFDARGVAVRFDERTARALGRKDGIRGDGLPAGTDLVIVAGGDGTLLSAARLAGPRGIPILGVIFGGLGFMTELQPEELYAALERVLSGHYEIEEREALRVRFRRGRKIVSEHSLLNDAVVTKAALARMLVIELRIDGTLVATYTSDGLIIATPTGSTAYALSAGGPILQPALSVFSLVPVCPHTLSNRPIVVNSDASIEVLINKGADAHVHLDSHSHCGLMAGDRIRIRRYERSIRLLHPAGHNYYHMLREKLHWSETL